MSTTLKILQWLSLFGAGLCAAAASVLLKNAASPGMPPCSVRVLALAIAAVAVYGAGFLLYGYSLRHLPVGVAYVCMVAVATVLLFAYMFVHGQPVHAREWVGAAAVIAGVYLIVGVRAF